jgi:hypothetical protein
MSPLTPIFDLYLVFPKTTPLYTRLRATKNKATWETGKRNLRKCLEIAEKLGATAIEVDAARKKHDEAEQKFKTPAKGVVMQSGKTIFISTIEANADILGTLGFK